MSEPASFLLAFGNLLVLPTPFCMRKRILVVDDNKDLLELLRLNLKGAGFSIGTAANGLEAVRKARSLLPDLILLDLMLPELDGFGVCEILRKDPSTASIPILLLSGLTGQFARFTGLESGATDFISKPAHPRHLISRIREILGPSGQAPQPA